MAPGLELQPETTHKLSVLIIGKPLAADIRGPAGRPRAVGAVGGAGHGLCSDPHAHVHASSGSSSSHTRGCVVGISLGCIAGSEPSRRRRPTYAGRYSRGSATPPRLADSRSAFHGTASLPGTRPSASV